MVENKFMEISVIRGNIFTLADLADFFNLFKSVAKKNTSLNNIQIIIK